jgi:hypothetical protein
MKFARNLIFGVAASAALGVAIPTAMAADDFGPRPADCEAEAQRYVVSRLSDERGAKIAVTSEPYRIYADLDGEDDVPAWGIDLRVKARLPNGQYGGYVPMTVIFVGGQAVAVDDDGVEIERA